LITISHAVSSNPIPSLLCLAALLYGCIHFKQIYHRATWLHGPLLRLPLIGGFLRMVMQETFCRSFVTLSRALPNFVDSLRLVRDSSTNFAFKGAVARSIVAVSHGDGLGVAMHREQSVFSSLIPQAVSTGEEVGNVSDVLEAISIQLSRDLLEYIERLKELLPPLLTAILAIVVFIVLAAIFVPLFILPTLI
jgi:type II secretory pathway component PulF